MYFQSGNFEKKNFDQPTNYLETMKPRSILVRQCDWLSKNIELEIAPRIPIRQRRRSLHRASPVLALAGLKFPDVKKIF